jgi:prepilin-type N-terminal cleavage/methylation domain-containing protein
MPVSRHPSHARRDFTLVELLTVVAVIGILAAILIPTVGKVREGARKAKSKVQFTQLASAIETFRQEYGFWPDFTSTGPNWQASNPNADKNLVVRTRDHSDNLREFLTGIHASGANAGRTLVTAGSYRNHPNRKRIAFYTFSEADLAVDGGNTYLVDSFGNTDILIVMDSDLNGIIPLRNTDEYRVESLRVGIPPPAGGPAKASPVTALTDVRANLIIYSAGAGGNTEADVRRNMVRSWEK